MGKQACKSKRIAPTPALPGVGGSPALARHWWSSFGSSRPGRQAAGERVTAVRVMEPAPEDRVTWDRPTQAPHSPEDPLI